ncbi:MAG: hypothetical protein QOJ41_2855 [Acidobacteriaceae bacterium]|jgi:hypothetical protein|nr:hypothetical protein [Acidobacteriaceae bacterium]
MYGCQVIVSASGDDGKLMLADAFGISAPGVVGHSAENLRNMGSALRAMSPPWHPRATNDRVLRTSG